MFEVSLVSNHQHRELVPVLDSQDLFVEAWELVEAATVCHGEDEQKTLTRTHVLLPHGAELLLSSRVQNCEWKMVW